MGSGGGMAAFVLEIEGLGRVFQSFPGWWQVVPKPLVCAGEICVSCRTGCACACRRGVPLLGRHRGQLMGEGGQEGKVFCFPSVCVSSAGGRSYCAESVGDAQPRNGRRAGNGDVLACVEVSSSWLHCVLSDKILSTTGRFGESVLENLYCWHRKYFSVQTWRDLLKISVLFGRVCCHVNCPSDL